MLNMKFSFVDVFTDFTRIFLVILLIHLLILVIMDIST